MSFVSDVSVPDGSIFAINEPFTKTWRLRNDGTCAWTSAYRVIFVDGERMSAPYTFAIPHAVAPGQTVDISVRMRAPYKSGIYRASFMMRTDAGVLFGSGKNNSDPFWLEINVQQSITTYDFVESVCSAQWVSAAGTLPCPGRDGDSRGVVLRLDNPKLENGTVSNLPGLLTIPQSTQNGYIVGVFPSYRVQQDDRFQSIVNCESGAVECYVVFTLDYQTKNNTIQRYWAFVEQYEGVSYQADIDISSLAGQDVKFILSVFAVGSADGDRAVWGSPRIVRNYSAPTSTPNPFYIR